MESPTSNPEPATSDRRRLLQWLLGFGVVGGLVAAYGTLAAFFGRFLFPARGRRRRWLYAALSEELPAGGNLSYRTPGGATVNIVRLGSDGSGLRALSSTCPHLGCRVHWQPQHDRFFCPCHNGVFDPTGLAIEGPPADAGQSLLEYPIREEAGLIWIELPDETPA